jgi:hypothetical protein
LKNFHLISPQEQLQYNFYESYDSILSLKKIKSSTLKLNNTNIDVEIFSDFNRDLENKFIINNFGKNT